jgi:protein SCO1/2
MGSPRWRNALALLERAVARPAFWVILLLVGFSWPIGRAVLTHLPPPPPKLGQVPDFHLLDQRGQPFTPLDVRGRVWVAGFVFTRCPSVCPALTQQMKEIQHRTKNLGETFQLVSFSVDPAYDTPEVLSAYAKEQGLKLDRWRFVTGETATMQAVVRQGFKILMEDAPPDNPIDVAHGTHVALVDADGAIRGYYDTSDAERVKELLRDAGLLVNRGGR